MKLIRHSALVVILRLAALCGPADGLPPGTPPLRVFSARDTGVPTMAWSVAQDADGTMYFGCNTVVSYNGDHWHAESMDATYLVRGLDVGPEGKIWAGGVNQLGWFERNNIGALQYHSLNDRSETKNFEPGEIWRAYADGPGRAFFVGQDKVMHWDGTSVRIWDLPGQNILWSARTSRAIYLHYPPQGLMQLTGDGPKLVISAAVLGSKEVRWIDDSNPSWLLVTSAGFERIQNGRCEEIDSPASRFVRRYTPTAVAKLPNGNLAVGTLQGGIALVDPAGRVLQVLNQNSGLPGDQIYSVFLDRDGALWGVGPAYIFRLGLASGASLYGERSDYPTGGADSLGLLNGSVFIAAPSGLLRLQSDGQLGGGHFAEVPIHSDRLYSVLPVNGDLLLGSLDGLARLSEQRLQPFKGISGAVFRTRPSNAHPPHLLAALRDRIAEVDPSSGTSAIVAEGLPDYGDSIADDPAGRVWIGTPSRGLFFATPGNTRAYPASPTFGPIPRTGPAYVEVSGQDVLALTDGGAFVLQANSDHFEPIAGLPVGRPSAISNPGDQGEVWAAIESSNGTPRLGRIEHKDRAWTWSPVSVEGLSDVGSILDLHYTQTNNNKELWIAGTQALLRSPTDALFPRPPRRPGLQLWRSHLGQVLTVPPGGQIPYSQDELFASFSSMDFGRRDPDRFETILEGAEPEWNAPEPSARRTLPALREGSYRIHVKAISEAGEESPEAVIAFSIAPPWWRSNSLYAVEAVGFLFAVSQVLRFRTRSLKKRAEILEQMVRSRTADLERANSAKTEFVASMSHEIRNPMGGIVSSALQLTNTPLSDDQRGLVATLSSCAQFLSKLVEDVLDFAAIEAGAYQITTAPFRPSDLLLSVVTMLQPAAGTKTMSVHVDEDLPAELLGDAGRIQQILVNFAANALKFGHSSVHLSARTDEHHCIFSVADDGRGISSPDQELLFVRFSRLKAARNSAIPGTGLGLAVSRELAQRMGGTVGVVSEEGKGALFYLRMPMKVDAVVDGEGKSLVKGRALVIEDVAYNARALVFMLKRIGYEADVAVTGSQALAQLSSSTYDAIFIDCDVPEIGGIEIARRFRKTESGRRSLIIATTALTTPENEQACREAGMDRFVAKPVTPEKLRHALTSEQVADELPSNEPGLDVSLLSHLSGGSPAALLMELSRYRNHLAEALEQVRIAQLGGDASNISSSAHRVLALAHMINATALAETARDLQSYAAKYTPNELSAECSKLDRHGAELLDDLNAEVNSAGA